jgi:hypothetical protein
MMLKLYGYLNRVPSIGSPRLTLTARQLLGSAIRDCSRSRIRAISLTAFSILARGSPACSSIAELSYRDFISDTFQGFLAPTHTSPFVVDLLSAKSIAILRTPGSPSSYANDRFDVLANGPRWDAQAHHGGSAEVARHPREGRNQAGLIRSRLRDAHTVQACDCLLTSLRCIPITKQNQGGDHYGHKA